MSFQTTQPEVRREPRAEPTRAELVSLTLQLLALLAVARGFRIQEGFGFLRLAPVLLAGFVLNGLAPARWRPLIFTLLSIVGIAVVLPFPASAILVAAVVGLLGICHLPVALPLRVGLLLVTGAVLAAMRVGRIPAPTAEIPTLVLPLLAAMCMFRLAIYLYDLRHERGQTSIWQRLSYFLMLPNVCFLLFPVVDYTRFRRTYYDAPAGEIYQKGLSWMLRGVLQLLLYRIVYQYFVPAPSAIQDLWSFAQFVISSYLLYLHISGQFHLIVGVLCLFGYNLPTTHKLYYLAPGFNEFWRRINIYWRDFMTKLVFYPTFSALAGRSTRARLNAATLTVFVSTWLLHSYQSFWLRGDFPLNPRDALFWGVLALLVVINSMREMRASGGASEAERSPLRRSLGQAASTVGTFALICLLWSVWSSASIAEWLAYASQALHGEALDLLLLGSLPIVLIGLGAALRLALERAGNPSLDLADRRPALYTLGGSLALIALLGAQDLGWMPGRAGELLTSLRRNELNVRDRELADRGYYEGVVDAGSFASALWKGHLQRPPGPEWAFIRDTPFVRFTGDAREYELLPSYRGSWRDAPFSTNSLGYRDAEPIDAPPHELARIALLGASYEMGAGVEDDAIYPAVLEELLNQTRPGVRRVEVLNLSVGGYGLVQRAELARRELPRYQPDAVILPLYTTEDNRLLNNLTSLVLERIDSGPFLEAIFARAGVRDSMSRPALRQALVPYAEEIMVHSLSELAAVCRRLDIPLVAVLVPTAEDVAHASDESQVAFDRLERLCESAGVRSLRLERPFADRPSEEVRLAPWDLHVNELGNRLLAEAFHRLILGDTRLRTLLEAPGIDSEEADTR